MNGKNIQFIENISKELSSNGVKYRIIDERWKKRGDIDIIVAKDSVKKFEKILKKNDFKRKGFWPPQSRTYEAFNNNERIPVGGHMGGFIGGFGGGLGRTLGKKLCPNSVKDYINSYLSIEEQIFVLLYKYGYLRKHTKYEKYYDNLIKKKIDYLVLKKLLSLTFNNPNQLNNQIKNRISLKNTKFKLKFLRKINTKLRGRFNKSLRFFYKIIFPSPYIAFVGCNGTGKSTTMKNLTKKLEAEKIKVATLYSGRFRFQILKPINYFLKFFKPNKIERGIEHHKGTKRKDMREVRIYHSKFLKIITPLVYYIEYIGRYLFKVYPLRIKKDVILTDRSFIDIFNSPNTNKSICKILFKLMPHPKHILLWNEPEILLKRRPEFQLRHLKEQLRIYSQFDNIYLMKIKTDKLNITNKIAEKIQKLI